MNKDLLQGSRSRIFAIVILAIMALFVVRLFYLQVIQHGHYTALAQAEQQGRFDIPAKRGQIYALSGTTPVPLVMNQSVYNVFIDPVTIKDKAKTIDALRTVAGGNLRDNLDTLFDAKELRYQPVASGLSRLQADKLKEMNLTGVGFQEVSQRVYPEGKLAAQTLGFVNTEGVGNYGIESALDTELKGTDGLLQTVTDVSDVPLTIGNNNIDIPAKNGANVVLTIDRNVQSKAEQALADGLKRTGATNGSVLIMDPQTGKVMAMANLPTYDPSQYNKVMDAAAFNNGTISAPYEPGSDVKTFTMATGIQEGVVKADDTYVNTDYITVGDRTISNATKGKTGTITFQTALTWSLNTGFVTIAQRLGNGRDITRSARDTMYTYFHDKFRLGEKTGIELAGEAQGTLISPDDPDGNAVRYSNMSFGQGLDATMIQVSAGFAPLINGGNYFKPTVIAGTVDETGTYKPNETPKPLEASVISQSTSDQMRTMMETARASSFSSVDKPGYRIGGKTGTSQVIKNGQYSDTETVATYLGYGGGEQADYVIMVSISGENKLLQGARDALPIFTDISNWMLDYRKIQPRA